jgi:dihydroorotate dehydrogenase (NAD+) catalytic subunit
VPPDLAVKVGPIGLKNPLVCGSGEHVMTEQGIIDALDSGVAAVVAKSANESEAARRQLSSAQYMLLGPDWQPLAWGAAPAGASLFNRSGLVDMPFQEWVALLARADANAAKRDAYVVASLIPADPARLPDLAAAVEAAGLRWLELNLSAPHAGELPEGAVHRPAAEHQVRRLTAAVRDACSLPLTVKLTAESDDVAALAAAAHSAGADAIALTGRHLGFLPDPATRRPVLGTFGAIGGSWALPLTLRWIAKTRRVLGARSGLDVARFLLAGASAVQATTVAMTEGPAGLQRMLDEFAAYLAQDGITPAGLVGAAADSALTYDQATRSTA